MVSNSFLIQSARFSFSSIHTLHKGWRVWRKGQIYTNKKNIPSLIAGHVLDYFLGENTLVKAPSQAILISSRIVEAIEQKEIFIQSVCRLKDLIEPKSALLIRNDWSKGGFLGTHTQAKWKGAALQLVHRIYLIAATVLSILKEAFILSMHILDAAESITQEKDDSVSQVFINMEVHLKKLGEHKEVIKQKIRRNKDLLNKIIDASMVPLTSTQLSRGLIIVIEGAALTQSDSIVLTLFDKGLNQLASCITGKDERSRSKNFYEHIERMRKSRIPKQKYPSAGLMKKGAIAKTTPSFNKMRFLPGAANMAAKVGLGIGSGVGYIKSFLK